MIRLHSAAVPWTDFNNCDAVRRLVLTINCIQFLDSALYFFFFFFFFLFFFRRKALMREFFS